VLRESPNSAHSSLCVCASVLLYDNVVLQHPVLYRVDSGPSCPSDQRTRRKRKVSKEVLEEARRMGKEEMDKRFERD